MSRSMSRAMRRTTKKIATILIAAGSLTGVWWAWAQPAPQPLEALVPAGALVYLEARDFGALLRDWDASAEKRTWLASSNYSVFSRSHLLLRFGDAQTEFAAAAGIPPDYALLNSVAGTNSVFAVYDIGKLEFLYITRLPSARALNTALWRGRGTYQTRRAAGVDYYVKTASGRSAAFAYAGDLLLLATRESALAGALELLARQNRPALTGEPWFVQSTAAAEPGVRDLRLAYNLERLVATHATDMVVVADLHGPREQMVALANLCEREMIQFKVIPSCFRVFVSGLTLETIAGTPVLGVTRLPLDGTVNVIAKRALDIVGATMGLLLSAPIVALFSAIVWLESRGSVFYRQRRWGVNGVPFDIIKIRSMKLNAEQANGAQWCVKDDPRRLRVGAFMRKWNIDELPQFWNVLKGEMSLVGPRPERPELIAGFKHQIPHYNARHHAKPGMTGWAQVNGLRGDTDLNERIQCDLWYLENWSLWLDLQIMLLTFFKRDNAY